MYIDRNEISEYPFTGVFYTTEVDSSKSLLEQEETENVILETKCDITEASHARVGDFIKAVYSIYVPFDKSAEDPIKVQRGHLFRASDYGVEVSGKVEGVFPSQLGGFVAYVQANDIEDTNT